MKGKIWSTKKINEEIDRVEKGLPADTSAFFDGKIDMKAADVVFDYTKEEIEELGRCAADVVYFGDNYCHSMTDEGIRRIKLRPYQEEMLQNFQDNRFVVMLASRQIGKCLFFNSKVKLKSKDIVKELSIGNLYYQILSKKRKLSVAEKMKWLLWRLYDRLNKQPNLS
jgi:hypothetical protein